MIQNSATLTDIGLLKMPVYFDPERRGLLYLGRKSKGVVYEKNHRFTSLPTHAGACLLVCSKRKGRRNYRLG